MTSFNQHPLGMMRERTMHSSCLLNNLPPEILAWIFERVVAYPGPGWYPRETPALLIALRQEPFLYHEAISAFYKVNTFRLTSRSASANEGLSEFIINTIHKLRIEAKSVQPEDYIYQFFNTKSSHPMSLDLHDNTLIFGAGLKYLSLNLTNIECHRKWTRLFHADTNIASLHKLRYLHLLVRIDYEDDDLELGHAHSPSELINNLNVGLGVIGLLYYVTGAITMSEDEVSDDFYIPDNWFWMTHSDFTFGEQLAYMQRLEDMRLELRKLQKALSQPRAVGEQKAEALVAVPESL